MNNQTNNSLLTDLDLEQAAQVNGGYLIRRRTIFFRRIRPIRLIRRRFILRWRTRRIRVRR